MISLYVFIAVIMMSLAAAVCLALWRCCVSPEAETRLLSWFVPRRFHSQHDENHETTPLQMHTTDIT